MPLLEIEHLAKAYVTGEERQPVLEDVDLVLDAGETLALTGESGSGKSTLLHLVGALDGFDAGEIRLAGTPLSGLDEAGRARLRLASIGLVFQQFNLVPSLTVAQNLALQARMAGRADPDWLAELGQRLGLSRFADRYPQQLSGGQQQRVAIGRALAARPPLLLADEPTGNLDETTSDRVLELMLELVDDTGAALFLVTHSRQLAGRLDRHLHLSRGRIA